MPRILGDEPEGMREMMKRNHRFDVVVKEYVDDLLRMG